MAKREKVYEKCPITHLLWDPCRDLMQARAIQRKYPKEANAIIVKIGKSRGKNRDIFPYAIAVRKGWA